MSDQSGSHTSTSAPTAVGVVAAADAEGAAAHSGHAQQPGVGAHPRTTGFLPPLGWLGLVLFVVGLIVIGIAVGTAQGGTSQGDTVDQTQLDGGSLGPVSGLPVDDAVGPNAIIGQAMVIETVPVFSGPLGKTIARVNTGTYGFLDSQPGWVHVVLTEPSSDGLYATGWLQLNTSVAVKTG